MAHEWRIDELARRSKMPVDTIRFYQREGLLPGPRRQGRHALYDDEHLRRLEQIRDLQARHLSLAAIRTLLGTARAGLAGTLFAGDEGDYTLAQLAKAAGVPRDLVDELESVGLLVSPHELGRESYDDADRALLVAMKSLLDAGLPREVAVRLGAIYASSFAEMRRSVLALFTGGDPDAPVDDALAFREQMAALAPAVLPQAEALLGYCHRRTVQLLSTAEA